MDGVSRNVDHVDRKSNSSNGLIVYSAMYRLVHSLLYPVSRYSLPTDLKILFRDGPRSLGHVQESPSVLPFDGALFGQLGGAPDGETGEGLMRRMRMAAGTFEPVVTVATTARRCQFHHSRAFLRRRNVVQSHAMWTWQRLTMEASISFILWKSEGVERGFTFKKR